ncbi:alpha-amylase family glycosyl hydrolase [Virgibacillus kekensis]|uniref:Alpha-amylase family glycosyl hydrolase n=1 Tax=Virgibacillus kekensis TaxID=202261 RepID=A0ABV9DM50_9BACI
MKRLFILLVIVLSAGLTSPVAAAQEKAETIHSQIIYNVLVDRFNNGDISQTEQVNLDDPNAYHGGDLKGITDKLDTLKELGYTTLVLSPIMDNAPGGFHGYWIENLHKVDPQYGTMEDLKKLVKEAHERDMKIVLEFVTNYVAETHPMLDDPAKADWVKPESDVASHQWLEQVVVLDQTNPEVQSFLTEAADFWIKEANIDGYRFHAADKTNPDFLEQLTTHIDELNPEFFQLADILEPETYNKGLADFSTIDAVENNSLYEPMAEVFSESGTPVSTIYETWVENGKKEGLNYIDNKYTERFTKKLLVNGLNPLTTWKLALTYLYTAPGTPMIYQGSEIPMANTLQLVQFNSQDEDLKKYINRVSALRSQFPALQKGNYELLGSSGAMSLFKRTYENESIYIAINNDEQSQSISIDGIESGMQLKGLLGDNLVRENEKGEFKIGLARQTAEVYVVQKDTGLNWRFIGVVLGVFGVFVAGVIYLTRKQKKREAGV